jgi:hypothetical protein
MRDKAQMSLLHPETNQAAPQNRCVHLSSDVGNTTCGTLAVLTVLYNRTLSTVRNPK